MVLSFKMPLQSFRGSRREASNMRNRLLWAALLIEIDNMAERFIRHLPMYAGKRDFGDLQQDRGNLTRTRKLPLRCDKQGIVIK